MHPFGWGSGCTPNLNGPDDPLIRFCCNMRCLLICMKTQIQIHVFPDCRSGSQKVIIHGIWNQKNVSVRFALAVTKGADRFIDKCIGKICNLAYLSKDCLTRQRQMRDNYLSEFIRQNDFKNLMNRNLPMMCFSTRTRIAAVQIQHRADPNRCKGVHL